MPCRALALLAGLAWMVGQPQAGNGAEARFEQIGQGDPRQGYESINFETRSRRLDGGSGSRLALAELAADPPLGLPPLANPPPAAHIDLGRRLFYDRSLSANGTLSCGMCHVPEQAFAQNELATPVGIEGRFVRRNAPALYNVGYRQRLFHDGRETSLVAQIWSPLLAANEMGNTSRDSVLERITANPEYAAAFGHLFSEAANERHLGDVLAAYQRALLSANSPFDRWFYGGDSSVMSQAAERGFFTFTGVGCHRCHMFSNRHALFTDDGLHRTGVEYVSRARESATPDTLQIAPGVLVPLRVSIPRPDRADEGAWEVSRLEADRWRYRTPSLRNVALTAPYMHDGSLRTLADVVRFYVSGGGGDPERAPEIQPLNLTEAEQSDLVAFLESLTGDNVDALALDARSTPIGEQRRPHGGARPDR